MKTILIVLTLTFIVSLNKAVASVNLTDLRRLNNLSVKEITDEVLVEMQKALQEFNFTKSISKNKSDQILQQQEAMAFLELAYKAINADVSGDSDSYFYNAYSENSDLLKKTMALLPSHKKVALEESLKNTKEVDKNGQDSSFTD